MKATFLQIHRGLLALLPAIVTAGETEDRSKSALPDPESTGAKSVLVPEPATPPQGSWRFGVAYAPMFNLRADFRGLGGFTNPLNPLPVGGGQDYDYDDGYVRRDSSGNAGGLTWNWGYERDDQWVDRAGSGAIEMSISGSRGGAFANTNDDALAGIELLGYRDIGAVPSLRLRGGEARWGLKTSLHLVDIDLDHRGTLGADVERLTDSFSLDGVVPPSAPYAGSFDQPGPLLGDAPSRTASVVAGGAGVAGSRDLDVFLAGLAVGPYLSLPVTERLSLQAEGGLSLALASGDYTFRSETTIPGVGMQSAGGSGDKTTLLPGAFLGISAIYELNESWSLYAAARYQYYDEFDVSASGSTATLDFGESYVLSVGALFRF